MYIPPCVDYYDVVWDCCSKQDSNRLQTLFNYTCRIALHHPRLSSSSALWNYLGLSSLSTCRKLHFAQLMFKCHNSLAPPYPSSVFHEPSHRYSTRNSNLVTSHLYLCVNICVVTNQLLHDNKQLLLFTQILHQPTWLYFHFLPAIFFLYNSQGA